MVVEKEIPEIGARDAPIRPTAVSPCTSDIHTVWAGAIGDRRDMILGHEAIGIVEKVGADVKDFKPGDMLLCCCLPDNFSCTDILMHSWRYASRMEIL